MPSDHLTVTRSALLRGGSDANFREFLHAFMVFARRVDAVRATLAEQIGVTPPQYEMLSHIRQWQGTPGVTVRRLAEELHCTGAFVTTEIGKLRNAGLVVKRKDPADARRILLRLSARCERALQVIAPVQSQLNDLLFASITPEAFSLLRELMPRLAGDGDRAVAMAAVISTPAGRRAGAA